MYRKRHCSANLKDNLEYFLRNYFSIPSFLSDFQQGKKIIYFIWSSVHSKCIEFGMLTVILLESSCIYYVIDMNKFNVLVCAEFIHIFVFYLSCCSFFFMNQLIRHLQVFHVVFSCV